MARRPEGPMPPPVVQRLWVRYAKRGRLRFSSHRDFQRAFERALRRAEIPVAFSAGFTPHPKVSFAGAAPTGMASEAEYLELGLEQTCDPQRVQADLDAALPPGLDILQVIQAPTKPSGEGTASLADRLVASQWQIRLDGVARPELAQAVAAFLAAEEVPVQRETKNGSRTLDARAAVVALAVDNPTENAPATGAINPDKSDTARPQQRQPSAGLASCEILTVVVRHATPSVRPDDVLAGLAHVAAFAPPLPPVVTRLAQGPLTQAAQVVADPFAC